MYPGPQGAQLFYPGMQQQRLPMYPQMVPGRWNPGPQGQMMGMPGPQGINYSLMPAVARGGGGPQRGRGRGRGGPGGQVRQGGPPSGVSPYDQRRVPDVSAANTVRYTSNVRNPALPAQSQPMSQPVGRGAPTRPQQTAPLSKPGPSQGPSQAPAQVGASSAQQPLTVQQLASAPEPQRKQMIGERLFPLVSARQPSLAGKITGMLLEMDNGELILLLESPDALALKIKEAMQVLEQAENEEEDEDDDEEEDA